ncbi:MAG: ATPase, T2SS/T4P/T4SS family, partial [Gaiellaceae bacterium]
MADVDEAGELIRLRVEHALTAAEVNLATEEGRGQAETVIDEVLRAYESDALNGQVPTLTGEERDTVARALRDDLIGLGAIAERMLSDPLAQEWMVNGPRRVFRDTGSRIERVPDLRFHDDRQVRAFLERLLEQVEGKRLDRISPRVEARLPDGSRLTAAIPPVSSNGHAICSIRRFRLAAGTLAELVELEFLSQQAADFLTGCVRAGKNIVVSGRVSSGKTTLLNALGRAVAGTERVVCCESSAELQLPRRLANCIGYEARPANVDGLPAVTLEDLVS